MFKIHLWLGLPSAIVLFVVCISGSIFTYTDELLELIHKPYTEVQVGSTKMPIETIVASLQKKYPKDKVASLVASKNPSRSYRFLLFNKENGIKNVFVNPYTGTVTGQSSAHQFFYIVAHLHSELLLGVVGAWLVKIATIIFLILIITGLVLWCPKKLKVKNLKNFFAFSHKHKLKRILFDHHRVLGFYFAGLLFFFSVTGVIMAFEPIQGSIAKAYGGGKSNPEGSAYTPGEGVAVLDIIDKYLAKPEVDELRVALVSRKENGLYRLAVGSAMGILTYQGTVLFVDKTTGKELIDTKESANANVENTLMALHTGKWCGWLGQLLTFLSGIVGAYLAATGFLIWWNKRKR